MFIYILCVTPVFAILCSEIDIGTDILTIGNIVHKGEVQEGWSPNSPSNIYSNAQSEVYFYVKGFDLLGPRFDVQSLRYEDESLQTEESWLSLSVSMDEEINGILKDYRAFKVKQICDDRTGESSGQVNITFKASTCDAITFSWIKECGESGSFREFLRIGLQPGTDEVVANGVVNTKFDKDLLDDFFTVPNNQKILTLYMSYSQISYKTFFKMPQLVTDHEVMYPKLSGSMMKAPSLRNKILDLNIEFNCKAGIDSEEEVMIIIELPYYKNLEIHFYKDCGIKKESKLILIILTALGMIFMLFIMWMHTFGKTRITAECVWKVTNTGMETAKRLFIMAKIKYRDIRSKKKCEEDIHTLYGII